jgi:hypothetical protein
MGVAVPAWRWVAGAVLFGAGLLFLPVEVLKINGTGVGRVPKVYWGIGAGEEGGAYNFREVESPLIFALPTGEGYSEVLMEMPVKAELSFARSVQRARFLNESVDFFDEPVDSMPSLEMPYLLGSMDEPDYKVLWSEKQSERLLLSGELGQRIDMRKVVWPDVEGAGQVLLRAEVEVSARGRVQHLFIEKPLRNGVLNQQLVRFLYGLKFEPGRVTLGWIEFRVSGER